MAEYKETDLLKMAIEAEMYFTDSTKAAFRNIVNKVPAADVVEVVRCKDCDKGEPSNVWDGWVFCQANKIHHKDDNFCSYGERKET